MDGVGDPTLELWIERFRGPLVGLLASWGADWGEAEELAMDAFAEAWLGRSRFRGYPRDSRAVGAWLRGIASNLYRSRVRSCRSRPVHPLAPADLEVADPRTGGPSDERLEALRAAFPLLSNSHQTVLRMFYLESASTRDVAALLGITEKAVESRLRHARRALQELAVRSFETRAGGEA